jgi:hypothetical protein
MPYCALCVRWRRRAPYLGYLPETYIPLYPLHGTGDQAERLHHLEVRRGSLKRRLARIEEEMALLNSFQQEGG